MDRPIRKVPKGFPVKGEGGDAGRCSRGRRKKPCWGPLKRGLGGGIDHRQTDASGDLPVGRSGSLFGVRLSSLAAGPMAEAWLSAATRESRSASPRGVYRKLPVLIQEAIAPLASSLPVRLLFQDEGRFGRLSDQRRCWVPLPSRPVVGHQVIREYVYVMTAVSPKDGRLASLVMPWVDSEVMSVFLSHTAHEFPDDLCVMPFDGAGWHRAQVLRVLENILLIPLLPYSPELNPVEHIWDYLRDAFSNKTFKSLNEVMDFLFATIKPLFHHPEMVHSI